MPPSVEHYQQFLAKAKDSGARPDCFPYSLWRGTGLAGAKALHGIGKRMLQGVPITISFNDSCSVFSPKGSDPNDAVGVIQAVDATSPLGNEEH